MELLTEQVSELQLASKRRSELVDAEDAEHKLTYLKGAMLKFMVAPPQDALQKEALTRVIAAILHFTPEESDSVKKSISDTQNLVVSNPVTGITTAWSSLFGAAADTTAHAASGNGGHHPQR